MKFDPMMIVLLALVVVMIFFTFRSNKKRREQMDKLNQSLVPGVEVMLNSGIFGTVVEVDEETNRVTLASGSSTFQVHRQAIVQLVEGAAAPTADVAPDDDPEFGERIAKATEEPAAAEAADDAAPAADSGDAAAGDAGEDKK